MKISNLLMLVSGFAFSAMTQAGTINIDSAEDWGGSHANYPASNVLDGSLSWSSRWAASGSPVNLQLNIGSVKTVSKVGIAWGLGDNQSYEFEIWTRAESSGSWNKVYDGYSSGNTESFEVYDIPDTNVQQVRIKTFGNSAGSSWTNIKEVELYDEAGNGELTINNAFDDGSGHGSYPATNVIDNNTNWASRWAGAGSPVNLTVELNETTPITQLGIAWGQGDSRVYTFEVYARPGTSGSWTKVFDDVSSGNTTNIELFDITDIDAQQIRIKTFSNSAGSSWTNITEVKVFGQENSNSGGNSDLDPTKAPSENFDLSRWYLSVPTDTDNSGTADSIKENELNSGYQSSAYFYTGSDGGMVFKCPVDGYKTSTNTSYTRTELREMLRAGNTSIDTSGVNENNWVFSSAPSSAKNAAGGVDGTLEATLAVNYVTTTGNSDQVGRVIIGQIHAEDDEPVRLYYRKLPGNSKGSIYFAHEPGNGNSEQWYEMIGSRSSSASNPADGISLNEKFSYEINVTGNLLTVKILREGKPTVTETVDMNNSGYDDADDWMYFKAGVYNQNNTGNGSDYVQATFYALEQTHN
ncbi:polysaccharide lyase family 7 protein [Catenovulum sp. 2E275]|uniref:polysaccharide lyase family 7 protein n=1 Tax=Catenovulum sp. 2E275 TaxID=2980497 RepID=UPI0021D2C325|nr:polysaccharide lyase family 7 protein [Catenovulum sp. 2E275]MCU4674033.1 polysaccharide lyase family 7 protein [Catenovulum sp. 2E275]